MNRNMSLVAVAIAALALIISVYSHLENIFEVGAPMPTPKLGQKVTIRERHFNRFDPNFSEVTIDEITTESIGDKRSNVKTKLGYEVISPFNPFLPSFEEKSTDQRNLYLEKNTIFGDTLAPFPLKIGNKSSNRIVGDTTSHGGRAWEYNYSCEVMGKENIQIQLGSFDTYKVVCTAVGNKNFKNTYYYSAKMEQTLLHERDGENPYYSELTEVAGP